MVGTRNIKKFADIATHNVGASAPLAKLSPEPRKKGFALKAFFSPRVLRPCKQCEAHLSNLVKVFNEKL